MSRRGRRVLKKKQAYVTSGTLWRIRLSSVRSLWVIFSSPSAYQWTDRILVLGSDNLYGKEPSFTVPRSQSTTAWVHEIRKYRLDDTLWLPTHCHGPCLNLEQWSFRGESVPLYHSRMHRDTTICCTVNLTSTRLLLGQVCHHNAHHCLAQLSSNHGKLDQCQ